VARAAWPGKRAHNWIRALLGLAGAALVIAYAFSWRVWEPFVSIVRSQERAAGLRRELEFERQEEKRLRDELWALSTVQGVEREAARQGWGRPGATRVNLEWIPLQGDGLRPPCRFDSTAAGIRQTLENNLRPLLMKLRKRRPIEPAEHNLTLE